MINIYQKQSLQGTFWGPFLFNLYQIKIDIITLDAIHKPTVFINLFLKPC